jgi:HD-GYP domain-containing protein (c-di-GMP phosphodiesterase class II)
MATAYQTLSETERAVSAQLNAQARAADEWEGYRHPHASRIAVIADALARSFNLAQQDRAALRLAALAHDLGILAMQRDYVRRSGPLTLEEQIDLARHPIIGEQEAARLGTPRAVQLLVRWHHEAWNGLGYPDNLQREQIPLAARILRVADAYASLTDDRPYRPARTEKDATRLIVEGAGLEFDPSVVQALLALEELPEMRSHAYAVAPKPTPAATVPAVSAFQPDSLPILAQVPALPLRPAPELPVLQPPPQPAVQPIAPVLEPAAPAAPEEPPAPAENKHNDFWS